MTIDFSLPKNWKTTLFGLIAAVASYAAAHPLEFPHWVNAVSTLIMSGALAGIGFTAKDSNVHSTTAQVQAATVEQTPKA